MLFSRVHELEHDKPSYTNLRVRESQGKVRESSACLVRATPVYIWQERTLLGGTISC